jgi:hypothetical protein
MCFLSIRLWRESSWGPGLPRKTPPFFCLLLVHTHTHTYAYIYIKYLSIYTYIQTTPVITTSVYTTPRL